MDSGGLCLGIDFMVQNMNDSYHLLVPCASKGNCFETLLFSSSIPRQKMTFQSQVQHHIFEFFQVPENLDAVPYIYIILYISLISM